MFCGGEFNLCSFPLSKKRQRGRIVSRHRAYWARLFCVMNAPTDSQSPREEVGRVRGVAAVTLCQLGVCQLSRLSINLSNVFHLTLASVLYYGSFNTSGGQIEHMCVPSTSLRQRHCPKYGPIGRTYTSGVTSGLHPCTKRRGTIRSNSTVRYSTVQSRCCCN